MHKILKFFFELGPLLIFFYLNSRKETVLIAGHELEPIFAATAGFIIATIISLIVTYVTLRKLPIMPLVSGVFIVIMGGITLYLNDDTFIKIKPTLVNSLFGTILLVGLKFDRIFLKLLLEDGFKLTDQGWHGLTVRWGVFFLCLAGLNEFVWRCFTTDQWVDFKVFGIMPLTMLFVLSQVKFLMKHMQNDEK